MADEKKDVPGPDDLGPPSAVDEGAATSEAAAIAAGKLDVKAKVSEHGRRERFRDHAADGAVFILWLLMITTAVAIFAVAWHILTPWSWLDKDQLVAVKAYIFSGAVIAAIGGYVRKYLD